MAINLRLPDFIPSLLVPPEANLVLTVGIHFLIFALYTLTITSHLRTLALVRIVLCGPATDGAGGGGMYGIMRVVDTCLVDLVVGVHSPPRWVVDDKVAPLPTTFLGRLGYAVDYLFSLSGTSIFKNTTWDWIASSTKRRLPSPSTPKIVFLRNSSWSLFKQYIVLDASDTLNKSRIRDTTLAHPVTGGGLSVPQQLAFAFSVCAGTALSISIPATLVAILCVACGAPVEAWPPMFDAPFSAVSLADFWTR